ncbi:uncharacterized protein DSM5745_05088 [Aspergillus mulundensis]|uniref:Amine oxidase domain-containing protein n=1 Tax=Aspergillus mulundensis TaxID=1810919 RepID=A0A3D8S640_9EURO|nr:hypothetical protein DSM5745_05088 [Aspergillus mulundensis]RDW81531.1 hypothetical protein DSM5745_05088 [Aspergillus mulundensis]
MGLRVIATAALLLGQPNSVFSRPRDQSIVRVTISEHVHSGGLANIHLGWLGFSPSLIEAIYASCVNPNSSSSPYTIGRLNTDNCVYLYGAEPQNTPQFLGKSDAVRLTHQTRKRSVSDTDNPLLKGFDALRAWYNGVASIKRKSKADRGVASGHSLKHSKGAIVGTRISGPATALMLDSVGVHNCEIMEAGNQVGGRFRTRHVAGTVEWAEMGPMRLPYSAMCRKDNAVFELPSREKTSRLVVLCSREAIFQFSLSLGTSDRSAIMIATTHIRRLPGV